MTMKPFFMRLLSILLISTCLPASAAGADTLQRIQNSQRFTIGFVPDYAPFSDGDAQSAQGYTVELCQQIGERLKQQLQLPDLQVGYQPVAIQDMLSAVTSGRVDILCSPIDETLTRREQVSFSLPVFISGLAVIMRRDAPAVLQERVKHGPAEATPLWRGNIGQQLDKFTFAVLGSSHSAEWVQQRLRQLGLKSRVVTANNTAEGIHMVSTGQADAFFDDRMVLLNYVAQDTDGEKLIVPERLFEETPAALALSRNDEDFRLLVDRSISSLLNSPQGEALYQRHFGEPSEQTRLLFHLYPQP